MLASGELMLLAEGGAQTSAQKEHAVFAVFHGLGLILNVVNLATILGGAALVAAVLERSLVSKRSSEVNGSDNFLSFCLLRHAGNKMILVNTLGRSLFNQALPNSKTTLMVGGLCRVALLLKVVAVLLLRGVLGCR